MLKKQEQVNRKKTELQQVKVAKEGLLKEREEEKVKLEAQEKEQKVVGSQSEKETAGLTERTE